MRSRSKGARRAATSVTVVSMAASLVGCADTPAMPLADVFHTESVAAEPTMNPPGYVEAAVSLDSCVLASPGVIDVTGQINLGITGVADDAAAVSQLVIEVLLGDSRVRGVLTGSVDGTGSFLATFPVEEIQGTDSAVVVESYIGDPGEFVARCHASLLTRAVTFLPADPIELVPAPGVTPRTG